MTFEQKTRTLATAAGCLAVLGSAVCEAAEEGREAPQEKANKDLPVKVCPSAPRQEAPAMPSLESVIAVWGFPMKMLADGYVEYDGWVGRQEFGTVMAFWKADSRTSAWYGLMNYPEDLADLSLRFKYVRTTATRFEVDCEGRKLRAVERVRTAAPFIKGEVFARRPLSRKWVNIFDGHIAPKARSLSAASPWRAAGPNNQPTKGRPEGRPLSRSNNGFSLLRRAAARQGKPLRRIGFLSGSFIFSHIKKAGGSSPAGLFVCVQAERAQASCASMRMPCSRKSRTMEAGRGFVAESTMTGLTQERLSGT